MAFQIEGVGNLGKIVAGRLEMVQAFKAAALQQFGESSFNGRFKAKIGTEGGIDPAVCRVGQEGADDRELSAERTVFDPDDQTFSGQPVNNAA